MLTALLDLQDTLIDALARKHKNSIWRTADISNIGLITITLIAL